MRKLFKFATFGLTASLLPLCLATTASATSTIGDDIDTKLEYQVSSDGSAIRYISTMELKNGRTLDDITKIDVSFTLTKDGEDAKESRITSQTTVYDEINGTKDKVDDTYYAVLKITDLTTRFSGWTITPNFKYYFTDSTTEDATSTPWLIGGKRLYFTNSYNWDDVYIFMYKDGVDSNAAWPGKAMSVYDAEHGVYYYDYPSDSVFDSLIFNNNNNGRQTEDTLLVDGIHSYDLGKLNSSGKYAVNEYTCAVHKWSEEYENDGATHYHVCEICGAKSQIKDNNFTETYAGSGVYYDAESEYSGLKDTSTNWIYVQDSYYGTTDIKVHYWGGTSTEGSTWSGVKVNIDDYYYTTDQWGRNIYRYDIGDSTGLLLNDGNGHQTGDFVLANSGNAFWLGDGWTAGSYNIAPNPYVPEEA